MRSIALLLPLIVLTACQSTERPGRSTAAGYTALGGWQKRAARFNSLITLPQFETTPAAIRQSVSNAIARADAALDRIGALDPKRVSFRETVGALDDLSYGAGATANRLALIKETSQDPAVREAATEGTKVLQEWAVGIEYRPDVYRSIKAYADTKPGLAGEDGKLFEETLRDYRRAGMDLPAEWRAEVEKLRKELTRLATDFQSNVTAAKRPVCFTAAELEGAPEDFLKQPGVKTGDDEYTVMANITWHYTTVMENAKQEGTRLKLEIARANLAREENVALLQKILTLRNAIAQKLGYRSWADYQIEPKMAKTAATAREFLEKLKTGLQPKFEAELNECRALKARDTGDPNAKIQSWDWRYYNNQLKKEKYSVDSEQLRAFFPYDKVLEGMFRIYQRIFGLNIEPIDAPYKWVEDLRLYLVSDAATAEPMGLFYLDMFPREGKYNHFAEFGISEGRRLPGGKYQRPVVALVCNFPSPRPCQPSLLTHRDVETLFHEFGHAMHAILTRANYGRFAGTSVPGDFVEAPSQMLENWVWDKRVLDSFAANYKNPAEKIPKAVLDKLKEAKLATMGLYYRRQLAFALFDLALHAAMPEGQTPDPVKVSNDILAEVFLPEPENTAFVAYFGHLVEYDAGYYGYAWADAIAADMATVFEKSPDGFFDTSAGKRLREEIYAAGDSRDVNVSIEKFLGRPRSIKPFLKNLGINTDTASK